jgi:hypothetical protein
MSDGGKITVSVTHSRNQETIKVATVGMSGGTPVNTIRSQVTYSSRTAAPSPAAYWDGILTRAMTQIS